MFRPILGSRRTILKRRFGWCVVLVRHVATILIKVSLHVVGLPFQGFDALLGIGDGTVRRRRLVTAEWIHGWERRYQT